MLSSKAAGSAAAAAEAARTTAPRAPGQKKSCDLCVFRKRKCDGVTPTCGFCLSRGSECHYSLRRPNRPRGYARHSNGGEQQLAVTSGEKSGSGHGPGEEESCEVQQRKQGPPFIGLKRMRLSVSPATGLVGTKENVFLGSFFTCLGFLPMTHERLIRVTLMDILLPSASEGEIVEQASSSGQGAYAANAGTSTGASAGSHERSGTDAASACALWCSIAMGALVQGQPPEQVAPYMHLAWTSLSQCFDAVTVESGRAFLMMAYLQNFMRDDDKFYRYLQHARRVVNRLSENTAQKQEIDDLVMMGDDTRIFHTAALEPSELDAYCTDESPALEVPGVIHKSDLCRLLLQADRRMMKAFLRDYRVQAALPPGLRRRHASSRSDIDTVTCEGRSESGQQWQGLETISREDMDADGGQYGYLSGLSIKHHGVSIASTEIDEAIGPSLPGDETRKCTGEARRLFARLGGTAEAPEIRAGVGSLLYNSILGYLDMVTGSVEPEAGLEKAIHCAGVIARYPGLCRFSTWRHLSHCLLSFLSKVEDVEPFEGLRRAYNSVYVEDAPEVPPHAEWTMVGFCDHIFCRSMDHLDTAFGGLSATEPPTEEVLQEQRWLPRDPHWLHDAHANSNHWASLEPEINCSSATSTEIFQGDEGNDAMLPFPVSASNISAQHVQYTAPAPGLPAVGPLPMACVNQVWPTVGQASVMPRGGVATDVAFPRVDLRVGDENFNGWHSSTEGTAASANASWVYSGPGATCPLVCGVPAGSSVRTNASAAPQAFGERAIYNAPMGADDDFRGVSGRCTSETDGSEGNGDWTVEETAHYLYWFLDAASSDSAGHISSG